MLLVWLYWGLVPMKVNDQASYGQVFGLAKEGPYRLRVWVHPLAASLPHRSDR